MSTQPKRDNKTFITFEAIEEKEMMEWIQKNLHRLWEINIERFPSGASIVKFRLNQEAEEKISSKKSVEDDL